MKKIYFGLGLLVVVAFLVAGFVGAKSSPLNAVDHFLIYATTSASTTTVYQDDLSKGEIKKLFEYPTFVLLGADSSKPKAPNLALSPDRQKLAYLEKEGLKIRNLNNGQTQSLIKEKSREPAGTYKSPLPRWEPSTIEAYWLSQPTWSADGQFIAFNQSLAEGIYHGLINTKTRKHYQLRTSSNFSWSPRGNSFLLFSDTDCLYCQPTGLLLGQAEVPGQLKNLQDVLKLNLSVNWAAFTSDGSKIFFSLAANNLSVIDADLSHFQTVGQNSRSVLATIPAGRDNFYQILSTGSTTSLASFNLRTGKLTELMPLPNKRHWASLPVKQTAYLALVGDNQLLILDLGKRTILFESAPFGASTTLVGLVAK